MTRTLWSARRLVPLGLVAVAATAAGAQAAAGGAATKPRPPRAMSAPLAAAPIHPAMPSVVTMAPFEAVCRRRGRSAPAPASAPPSEALKNAFGILRRDRNDDDAVPAKALAALKASGLKPVDPQSARLLRSAGAAKAWVVPVPDVGAGWPPGCVPRRAAKPREGLAVVSLGGAPAGGGGGLTELQRGTAPVAMDPCAGAGRTMLSVSGIVPDGVDGVFITAADGGATRADVHDNGFSFVLPRPQGFEPRYLVWTGSDGKPHVQPLVAPPVFRIGRGGACPRVGSDQLRITPSPGVSICGSLAGGPNRIVSPGRAVAGASARARARARARVRAPRRAPRAARPRPAPVAAAPLPAYMCAAGRSSVLLAPTPIPPRFAQALPAPGRPALAPRPSRPRPPRTP